MQRRSFLRAALTAVTILIFKPRKAQATLLQSPVKTNRLRPPGAVDETLFAGKCIRCGRCVEICPYRCIKMIDIRHGVHAGTPLIEAEHIPCYLCMKCVDVCPTGSLQPIKQQDTRMGLAVINKFQCTTWANLILCRTCYDKCPYKDTAIHLDQLRPVVSESTCTGCGLCTHACPITNSDGSKAINIEPIYAHQRAGETDG